MSRFWVESHELTQLGAGFFSSRCGSNMRTGREVVQRRRWRSGDSSGGDHPDLRQKKDCFNMKDRVR